MAKITLRNFPRLDDEGIKEMASGIVQGQRYIYPDQRETMTAALWLLFTEFSDAATKNIAAIIGDVGSNVTNQAVNGIPFTYRGWIVHKDDWPKVVERIDRIQEVMNA